MVVAFKGFAFKNKLLNIRRLEEMVASIQPAPIRPLTDKSNEESVSTLFL
jgi:hypothetical protein